MKDDTPVEQNLTGLRGTLHHLDTFWQHRDDPNVLLFHFADLQADLDGEMRRLAAGLGIEVDEEHWPALVAAAGFEPMRQRADQLAPQVKIAGFWNDTSQFFRQGSSGSGSRSWGRRTRPGTKQGSASWHRPIWRLGSTRDGSAPKQEIPIRVSISAKVLRRRVNPLTRRHSREVHAADLQRPVDLRPG